MKNSITRSELVDEALEFFYKHYGVGERRHHLAWDERQLKQSIELYMTEQQLMDFINECKGEKV